MSGFDPSTSTLCECEFHRKSTIGADLKRLEERTCSMALFFHRAEACSSGSAPWSATGREPSSSPLLYLVSFLMSWRCSRSAPYCRQILAPRAPAQRADFPSRPPNSDLLPSAEFSNISGLVASVCILQFSFGIPPALHLCYSLQKDAVVLHPEYDSSASEPVITDSWKGQGASDWWKRALSRQWWLKVSFELSKGDLRASEADRRPSRA